MIVSLVDNAAALAADGNAFRTGAPAPMPVLDEPEPMPELDIPDPDPNGYPQIKVHLAWLRVRAEIKSIGKGREYKESEQAKAKFKFRGVDDALNAFAPITLLHGVNIIPNKVDASFRDARTSTGKPTRECTVTVTWRIYGPMGDYLECQTVGESLDGGDKGSAKAQSVALRVLLFGAGLIPTGDPSVDMSTIERGDVRMRTPNEYLSEIVDESTTGARMSQILHELRQARMDRAIVRNELGQDEAIGAMVQRVGDARFGQHQRPTRAAEPAPPAPPATPAHTDHLPGIFDEHCPGCFASAEIDRQAAAS